MIANHKTIIDYFYTHNSIELKTKKSIFLFNKPKHELYTNLRHTALVTAPRPLVNSKRHVTGHGTDTAIHFLELKAFNWRSIL